MLTYLGKFHYLTTILAASILWLSFQPLAGAAIISTDDIATEQQSIIERDALLSTFDREEVKQALIQYGVNPQHAKQRVASMTDDEIALLNGQIADLPAGADTGFGFVVLVLLIVGFSAILAVLQKMLCSITPDNCGRK